MGDEQRTCPDGGYCHHLCQQRGEGCFRVAFCAPFTGTYPDEQWPDEVRDIEAAKSSGQLRWRL